MTSIYTSFLVGVLTLGGGVGGLLLQRFLPEQHTSERSRDMLGAIVGLISLLSLWFLERSSGPLTHFTRTKNRRWKLLPRDRFSSIWRLRNMARRQSLCGRL